MPETTEPVGGNHVEKAGWGRVQRRR
jgi:hypothetical protein